MVKKYLVKDVAEITSVAADTFETDDLAEAFRTAADMTAQFKLGYADYRVFTLTEVSDITLAQWKAQYRVKGDSQWHDDTATFAGVGSDADAKFEVWRATQPQRDYEYRLVAAR